jgi:hypothetical protein
MRAQHYCVTSLALIAMGVVGLACGASSDARPSAALGDRMPVIHQGVTSQVNPNAPLADLSPAADPISVGIVILPDPLVPRYRRLYDLSISALELGMLRQGYVLDRYSLPWIRRWPPKKGAKDAAASDGSEGAAPAASQQERMPPKKEPMDTASGDGTEGPAPAPSQQDFDDPLRNEPFGLMVFRCDAWREQACGSAPKVDGSRFRALYVITDTATYGVSDHELRNVMMRISEQLTPPEGGKTAIQLLGYPACGKADVSAPTLVVLGPNFSGAMDSLREQISSFLPELHRTVTDVCLVSSSATNPTNSAVEGEKYRHIRYVPLALDDWGKLANLAELVQMLRGFVPAKSPPSAASQSPTLSASQTQTPSESQGQQPSDDQDFSDVVLLAESSTFGYGVCDQGVSRNRWVQNFCDSAQLVYFPSSIADIRYGLQQQQQEQQSVAHNPLNIPIASDQLPVQMGTENGSEYPESRQYGSTSVSKQLALAGLLNDLKDRVTAPRVVVVIATDVRDRLFLFDELRKRLPRAMLVDLEADNLLAHPDFLHASRGALSLGSAALVVSEVSLSGPDEGRSELVRERERFGCRGTPAQPPAGREKGATSRDGRAQGTHPASSSWSTDYQTILADTVSRLSDGVASDDHATDHSVPCLAEKSAGRRPVPQVVTLEGFHQVALRPESERFRTSLQVPLHLVSVGAPLFCLTVASIWVAPWIWLRRRKGKPSLARDRDRRFERADKVALVVCALYSLAFVWATLRVRDLDRDNTLPYWSVALVVLGGWGLLRCRRLLLSCAEDPPRSQVWLPALFALAATVLAAMPAGWQYVREFVLAGSEKDLLDESALLALAIDPDQGLAFFLAAAVGAAALLYASLVLTTAAYLVHRNARVVEDAKPSAATSGDALWLPRPPKCPVLGRTQLVGAIGLIAVVAVPDLAVGHVRLTIFGLSASRVALCALSATSLAAMVLMCGALGTNRRAKTLSGYLRNAYVASRRPTSTPASKEIPGAWPAGAFTPAQFPATPVIARASDADRAVSSLLSEADLFEWRRLLRWLHPEQSAAPIGGFTAAPAMAGISEIGHAVPSVVGHASLGIEATVVRLASSGAAASSATAPASATARDSRPAPFAADLAGWSRLLRDWLQGHRDTHERCDESEEWAAVFVLLASEISLHRWMIAGAVLCAVASVGIVYLFPIESDLLLALNLLILVAAGALAGYTAMTCESDGVMSNVLCGRCKKVKLSIALFGFVAAPFVALAIAIGIANIPGVLDWSGGLITLLESLGLHL